MQYSIRALQLADLRARRLCGRHQIASDGKHLIDGVPFGLPFIQRTTNNRPAITIPPRKKRRTVLSGWGQDPEQGREDPNADEEGDGEWLPPGNAGFGKELSILPTEHDMSMGTVIRHPVDYSADEDSEEADEYEPEENELESELKALKEDFEQPPSQFIDIPAQDQVAGGTSTRSSSAAKRPSSADALRRGSLMGTSSLSSKRSRVDDLSPRTSKAVRFNKGQDMPEPLQSGEIARPVENTLETSESDSDLSSSSDSDVDSSSEDDSSEESASEEENSDSSSDSDDSSSSDSEEVSPSPPSKKVQRRSIVNPPGEGSIRTKKSNNRYKLRRRLSKLKELGVLNADADFAALRAWEEAHGGWHYPEEASILSAPATKAEKADKKEQEQREFEAKRQKLLRDLASGGVDVGETSEKENVPPRRSGAAEQVAPEETVEDAKPEKDRSSRRSLDVASSRRLLFGSLGIRTPKTKEEEEEARRKAKSRDADGRRGGERRG